MSTEERIDEAEPFGDTIDVSSRDGFEVEVQHAAAKVIVLHVAGRLDLWTSLPLMDAIIGAFHEHAQLIAVDVSDMLSMDDTGLRVLMDGAGHSAGERVRFAVICPAGHPLAPLLEQADGSNVLSVHESLDDALRPRLDGAGELPAGV